jgi:Lrp/AsnC family leucine-responsive transcriptional regulator
LDSLDRELLKNLQDNARLSLRELGRRLKVPHTTIFTRVNKLVEKGVIKEFSAILHPHDLGFKINFVVVDAPQNESRDIAFSIAACEDVMKIFRTTDGKIIVKAVSKDGDPRYLNNFLAKLEKYPVTVYSVDEVVKYDHKLHDDFIDLVE